MDSIDDVSRYRFIETFGLTSFENTSRAIESGFRQEMNGFELWIISKVPSLCTKIRSYIETSIDSIIDTKHDDKQYWGAYLYQKEKNEYIPSIHESALNTFAILKFSNDVKQIEIAKSCVEWIWLYQNNKGYWISYVSNGELENEPSVLTTLIVLQVLNLADKEKYKVSIKKGEDWILNQQESDGFWDEKTSPNFVFLSTSILDYFFYKDFAPKINSKVSKDQIINLISEGEIEKALEASLALTFTKYPTEYKDIVLLSSQFHEFNRRKHLGLLWDSTEFAKINNGLIEIISKLK